MLLSVSLDDNKIRVGTIREGGVLMYAAKEVHNIAGTELDEKRNFHHEQRNPYIRLRWVCVGYKAQSD